MSASVNSLPPKLPPKRVVQKQLAKVVFPYQSQHEDELTIQEGDIITIISKDIEDQGWWKGELKGKVGVFPDNYVTLITKQPKPITNAETNSPNTSINNSHGENGSTSEGKSNVSANDGQDSKHGVTRAPSESKLNKVLSSLTSNSRFNELLAKNNQPEVKTTAESEEEPLSTSVSNLKSSQESPIHTFASLHNRKPKIRTNKPLCKSESAHEIGDYKDNTMFLLRNKESSQAAVDLNSLDTNSANKLRHLTATRVKGPRSRRPPSLIHLNQNQDEQDDCNGSSDNICDNSEYESNTCVQTTTLPTSGTNSRLHSRSNSMSDNSKGASSMSCPPWMVELKRNQEKKNENRKKSLNGSEDQTSNGSSVATKTFGVISPVLPTKPTAVTLRHSGDFGNSRLSKDQSSSLSRCNSISGQANATSSSSTVTHHQDTCSDAGASKEAHPSITSAGQPPPITACKPARAAKPNVGKLIQTHANSTGSAKETTDTTKDTGANPAVNLKDYVTRKEFDELLKKVNDLTEMMETQKTTYRNLIKDCINDLAEEKKKVANLHIEVDRLRKITSTV